MTNADEVLYNRMRKNMMEFLKPQEYAIAARFFLDGFTMLEVQMILDKLNLLPKTRKKILEAYIDFDEELADPEDFDLWQNDQVQQLRIRKLREKLEL